MEIMEKLNLLVKISIIKSIYYSIRFKGIILLGKGSRINIKKNGKIKLSKNGKLLIGINFSVPIPTVVDIYQNGVFTINGMVRINKGCKIMIGPDASLIINNNTYINEFSRIQCRKSIVVGKDCAISWNVDIIDSDEHQLMSTNNFSEKYNQISIGNNVWIGLKAIILKGSVIEDNVIIGAAALVKGHCINSGLYVGVPCKLIKNNVKWKR